MLLKKKKSIWKHKPIRLHSSWTVWIIEKAPPAAFRCTRLWILEVFDAAIAPNYCPSPSQRSLKWCQIIYFLHVFTNLDLLLWMQVRASSEAPSVRCMVCLFFFFLFGPPPSVHRGGARMAHHPEQPSVDGPDQHLSAGRGRPLLCQSENSCSSSSAQLFNVFIFLCASAEIVVALFGNICWSAGGGPLRAPSGSVSAALGSITRAFIHLTCKYNVKNNVWVYDSKIIFFYTIILYIFLYKSSYP